MAEALGVAGSAVGIVSLGIQVCQGVLKWVAISPLWVRAIRCISSCEWPKYLCYGPIPTAFADQNNQSYYGDWKDCDDDILRMYSATVDQARTFWFLKAMLNSMSYSIPPDIVNNVERNIVSCEGGIFRLECKLGKLKRHGGTTFKDKVHDKALRTLYPFQAKSLAKLSMIVSELRDNLGFALSTLQTWVKSHTYRDWTWNVLTRHLSITILSESKKLVGGIDDMRSEFNTNTRFMSTNKLAQDLKEAGASWDG